MHRPLRLAAIVGAGFSLASFSPLPGFSAAALDALDPSRLASLSCGVRRAGSALANELLIASAIAAPASAGKTIPLYPDLAASPFPVSTRAPQARRYFSQGLILTYGFNHAGAVRSFREAQRLDPECAMCWWGEAVALGPNINAPMDDRDHYAALDAMDRAMALRSAATPMERALIEA
ncbi:MAG TPA: hypothetical protein VN152_03520, partial [Sphingopyxis sp.]|nr:hypothetical protein [Sphingopyxis sp.]